MSSAQIPWIEKYRPKIVSDIVGNTNIVDRLDHFSQVGNCPNIILAGPPGCGKTTSILCMSRELLGDNFNAGTLELNASNERGIDVIRGKIKEFATRTVRLNNDPEKGKVQHKIIILDEADSMTDTAQQALRRIMEIYWRFFRGRTSFFSKIFIFSQKTEFFLRMCTYLPGNKIPSYFF